MLSKLQVAKRRKRLEMLPRSFAITITRRVVMPRIVLWQKTSCGFSNLHVGDCKYGG